MYRYVYSKFGACSLLANILLTPIGAALLIAHVYFLYTMCYLNSVLICFVLLFKRKIFHCSWMELTKRVKGIGSLRLQTSNLTYLLLRAKTVAIMLKTVWTSSQLMIYLSDHVTYFLMVRLSANRNVSCKG